MVEFRILGPLEVTDEHGPVSLGGQKHRAVLALLLLRAGEVVATDRLVAELWGEQPPKTATTSLKNSISQLRKLLGPGVVATKPPGYQLRVDPTQVDLARFERLCAEARDAPYDRRSALLREALALWRGPPLADLAYEAFAQGEIRRLEELRMGALEARIDADLESGRGGELVAELESLVRQYPLRERLRGQLMLALYRSGRQAEALEVYHQGRHALGDELGIDPSPDLKQLYGSILRQETVLQAEPAAPLVDPHDDVARAMLAGRLVIVLGSGISGTGDGGLPGFDEVAAHLAESFDCPPDHDHGLTRVSQYVALMKGIGPLYDELHAIFDRDFSPVPAHTMLVGAIRNAREQGAAGQLVLTANFDQALEHALTVAGERFDVVSYIALGRHRGRFLHVPAEGDVCVVELPNAYDDLTPESQTVILKIHGGVDRQPTRTWDSFAVSEDDYIDYLAQDELAESVPMRIVAKLRRSHFLFLGYPLRDWHVRVFLHRLWGREKPAYRSWAVEAKPDPVELESWRSRGVDVVDASPEVYLEALGRRLGAKVPV
jgi:DNA-binding SARP family transcriptional activator